MQKILVVEDDIDIQDILKNHLTDAEYEVVIADDGVDGIAKFDDTISLVLLDIMLTTALFQTPPSLLFEFTFAKANP